MQEPPKISRRPLYTHIEQEKPYKAEILKSTPCKCSLCWLTPTLPFALNFFAIQHQVRLVTVPMEYVVDISGRYGKEFFIYGLNSINIKTSNFELSLSCLFILCYLFINCLLCPQQTDSDNSMILKEKNSRQKIAKGP